MVSAVKRRLVETAEPRGRSAAADRLRLSIWDARGLLKGSRPPKADPAAAAASPPRRGAGFYRDHLLGNVIPFWTRHSIDREHGGYLTHLDSRGRLLAADGKHSAMQARIVHAFSLAYRLEPDPVYLELANHGLSFLREHMWDPVHGGWFRSVTREGEVRDATKRTAHQAFTVVGLLSHRLASGDETSREAAEETLRLLDEHVWDTRHGGYQEESGRDWSPVSRRKTACVHEDLLTALLLADEAGLGSRYGSRIDDLCRILTRELRLGASSRLAENCQADWTYSAAGSYDALDVGHGMKAAALLAQAAIQRGSEECIAHARAITDSYLDGGWDRRHGGLFTFLLRGNRLASDEKRWWTQAEGIVALAALWRLTGEERYRRYLDALTEFCVAHFIDPAGEWYTTCGPDGTVRDSRKGDTWKGPYHTARAGFYGWLHLRAAGTEQPPALPRIGY